MAKEFDIHFASNWKDTFCNLICLSIIIWSMFYVTTTYFYITTFDKQLKWITNDNEDKILFGQKIIGVVFLLSGGFTIIAGPMIDKCGMKFTLIVMSVISIITSISSYFGIYYLELYVVMIGIILNQFFYFTMAPLLIVTIFGATKLQFIYGMVLFLQQYLISAILFEHLSQDILDGNYGIINLIMGILVFFLQCGYYFLSEITRWSHNK